ncbi:MAG: hypothetical protein WCG83_07145 [Candidatus Peregrinibacteria bacterium]
MTYRHSFALIQIVLLLLLSASYIFFSAWIGVALLWEMLMNLTVQMLLRDPMQMLFVIVVAVLSLGAVLSAPIAWALYSNRKPWSAIAFGFLAQVPMLFTVGYIGFIK